MRLALLTALAGCSTIDPCAAGPGFDERCSGELRVDLVDGATEFRVWESLVDPDAILLRRLVECDEHRSLHDADLWWVVDLGSALVLDGLVYGDIPEGATEKETAGPLLDGETYMVSVQRGGYRSEAWDLWFVGGEPSSSEHIGATVCPSWWPQ